MNKIRQKIYNRTGWLAIIISGSIIIFSRIWQFCFFSEHTEIMMLKKFGGMYIICILLLILGRMLIKEKQNENKK